VEEQLIEMEDDVDEDEGLALVPRDMSLEVIGGG
jgi:hypothetical protein